MRMLFNFGNVKVFSGLTAEMDITDFELHGGDMFYDEQESALYVYKSGSTARWIRSRVNTDNPTTYLITLDADTHVSVKIEDTNDVLYEGGDYFVTGSGLVVTLTFDTGYEVDTFTVNSVAKTSPATLSNLTANQAIVVESKTLTYDLTVTDTQTTVVVKVGGETVEAGTDAVHHFDVPVVTAVPATGYEISVLTYQYGTEGEPVEFDSGDSLPEVADDLTIVATSTIKKYDLTINDTSVTVVVTVDATPVTEGADKLTHGDLATVTATAAEGFTLETLTYQFGAGEPTAFESGATLPAATGDLIITATATENE